MSWDLRSDGGINEPGTPHCNPSFVGCALVGFPLLFQILKKLSGCRPKPMKEDQLVQFAGLSRIRSRHRVHMCVVYECSV